MPAKKLVIPPKSKNPAKHAEPDADDKGGKPDMDADDMPKKGKAMSLANALANAYPMKPKKKK